MKRILDINLTFGLILASLRLSINENQQNKIMKTQEKDKIEESFTDCKSALYSTDSTAFLEKLISLCDLIESTDTDEFVWSIGEFEEFTLDALLVGAYWALTEWHGGQNSLSYAAMCSVGSIFNPGMTSGPEEDSSEMDVYNDVCQLMELNNI